MLSSLPAPVGSGACIAIDEEHLVITAGLAMAIGPSGHVIARYLDDQEGIMLVDLSPRDLAAVRTHRMRYFLPNRRPNVYRLADEPF